MEKIWLKSYPPGVPEFITLDTFQSLAHLFEESCKKYATEKAFANFGTVITYQQLYALTHDFAAYMTEVLKMQKGDRLAIMLPNVMQYPIAIFGAFRAGLTIVNVNPLYTARELELQLKDSGATAILILENVAHILEKVLPHTNIKHVIVTRLGDCVAWPKSWLIHAVTKYIKRKCPSYNLPTAITYKQMMHEGSKLTLNHVALYPEDIAFLQYTGGTTGTAKGAELTHRNLISNIEQVYQWTKDKIFEKQEVVVTALPLYHIFSLTANCLVFLRLGAFNVLITNPRDTKGFVKELQKVPFTILMGVNTLFNMLLHEPSFSTVNFKTLRFVLGGGMSVQRAVAMKWHKVTGTVLYEAYGLTETSPAAVMNPFYLSEYSGSIGLPIPSTEIKILNEDGNECPKDQPGELCIRGPQVMQGYWNQPEETKLVLDKDGWFKTGDIAKIDEKGFIYIVDRKKDMILVSGFNVYPNEIEDVLAAHPGIIELAAVGIPDEKTGEAVKIFVVAKDPNLTEFELHEYCRTVLTGYKIPKYIEFRQELPKSNVGKILRRTLRDEARKQMASFDKKS